MYQVPHLAHDKKFDENTITSPIVDFRLVGTKEVRRFVGQSTSQAIEFVNIYCRPLCVFNGADITTIKKTFQAECDYHGCYHEWKQRGNQ